jgi:thiosulfate/3-mercaptopyruvate sulfurtransferase
MINIAELAAEVAAAAPLTLIDVRWSLTGGPGRASYAEAHLPGAVFLDLDGQLCGPPKALAAADSDNLPPAPEHNLHRPGAAGRHPLPEPDGLQEVLRAAGVRAEHPVVVYDGGDGLAAGRAWWTLRWAGHPWVRVLDGGYAAWVAAGQPVTAEPAQPPPGTFTVRPGALPVLDAAGAAELAGKGVLLDVRAGARFRGETEPIDPVAGHIPGAVNLPTTEHLDDQGRLRAADELRDTFASAGVREDVPVGAYCGSGVTAAHTVLALHRAGRPDAALYVGSWSEWITDPDRPVARGAS